MHGVIKAFLVALDRFGRRRQGIHDLIKEAVALVISEDVLDVGRLRTLPLRLDTPHLHRRLYSLIIAVHKLVGLPQSFKITFLIRLWYFLAFIVLQFLYSFPQQV